MTYGLKYFAEYKRLDGELTRLEIEEFGYNSYSIESKMVSCIVSQGNGNDSIQDVIKGTKVNIGLATIAGQNTEGFNYDLNFDFENVTTYVDYKDFYTQDETKYRVTLYREDGVIFFRGFILPDIFLDEYVDFERIINFTASDRLNRLVDIDIEYSNDVLNNMSIANVMMAGRDSLLLGDLGLITGTRFKETTGAVGVPTSQEVGVNRNFLYEPTEGIADDPRNFDIILEAFAKTFFSHIFQWKGNLYLYSIVNSAFESVDIASYTNDAEDPTTETLDITQTNISGKMLSRPTIEGQPTARKAKLIFKIGSQTVQDIENLVVQGDFEQGFVTPTWNSMSGPGGFVWKLANWTYINCDYSNQASRGPDGLPSQNYVVMHRQWQTFSDAEGIESKTRLGEFVSPTTLLRFSLKYQGLKTNNSKSGFEDMESYFVFMLIIRNDTDTYYLKRDNGGAFSWTTLETTIRIKFTTENFRVWNDFIVENLVPPITGKAFVRLYNTQQLGSTHRYRFHSAYDDVTIALTANDNLESTDIIYEKDTGQGYSSFSDDYEVILGDFQNSLSESALMIDGRPTQFWAFSGSGSDPILAKVLSLYADNTTNPRLTLNCRVQLPDLDITKGVIVDGTKYRINHWSLDDHKNIWTLELHQVYS